MGIPVNVVTGTLGVGKTSALLALLASRPEDEHWAVLVNEFGAMGVDGALLGGCGDRKGFTVREVAGGCMCCANGMPLNVIIAQLLRQSKPQRLLIEPSGLGHPAGLVDVLRSEHLMRALDLQAVVCLVDPRLIQDDELACHEGFINQVSISDVLVANKADLASESDMEKFDQWAAQLYPPKMHVCKATHGAFDPALLDIPFNHATLPPLMSSLSPSFIVSRGSPNGEAPDAPPDVARTDLQPAQRQPVMRVASGESHASAGWVFHVDDIFDRSKLETCLPQLMTQPGVMRCKGVFRLGKEWFRCSLVAGAPHVGAVLEPVAYRHDSRIEIIVANHNPLPKLTDEENHFTSRLQHSVSLEDFEACHLDIFVRIAAKHAIRRDWDGLQKLFVHCLR